ncbi:MAG: metallophosphoesterase family protein [Myxococcales bacterium]|nr:metallophosphoesterase family protein [Myxococcales bacterium]
MIVPEVEQLTRVGLVGDVHCEDVALAVALETLEALSVDRTLCVGDLVDGHGDIARVVSLLREHDVLTVAGNHERWFLAGEQRDKRPCYTRSVDPATRAYIEALPTSVPLSTPAGPALLCHAIGDDDMSFLFPDTRGYALMDIPALRELMVDPNVEYLLCGHTHQRMVRVFQGLVVVNAGTLRREDDPGFCVVDFAARTVEFFRLAGGHAKAIETLPLPPPAALPPAVAHA